MDQDQAGSLRRDAATPSLLEERLRRSEALVRGLVEASPDPVFVKDRESRVLVANPATLAAMGRSEAEVLGRRDTEIYADPEVGRLTRENDRRVMASGRAEAIEETIQTPGGERVFLSTKAPLRDAQGQVIGVIGIARDITERKRAEAALQEREERVRLALAAARQVEWEYDAAEGTRTVGPGWRELTGHDGGEVSTLDGWRAQVHPDDRDRVCALVQACLEGRSQAYEAEYRVRGPGGEWRWVRSRGRPSRRGPDGGPVRLVGTTTDVDEIHALQEKLVAASRLASVGTLAAGVAHEINNPLTWLQANLARALELVAGPGASLPGEPALRARLGELLQEALQGSSRIAGVVQAMRSLGRPERAVTVQPIDVRVELLSALQMVRNQLTQRARLEVAVPEALPRVRAATTELGRAFLNLLVNAAQAIPEGQAAANQITVAARQAGPELVVEIADTGAGLAPEVRERIFDPFFTTRPVGQGSGLGLTISRSIVDAAGGRIEVESAVGRGATFRVCLPVAAGPLVAPIAPAKPALESAPRRRVLVVDDEPLIRRALARMLRTGHEVDLLDSAGEALWRIRAGERWDAILCDLMMPGLDGIGFYEALASSHPGLLPSVAFITGGAFGERAERFLADHEVVVVPKPVEATHLAAVIDRLAQAGAADHRPRR